MYIQAAPPAGSGQATYLYAHARDGMFGPIYERAIQKKNGGPKSMLGMLVEVYTSDDQLFVYEITEVRLHQLNLDDAARRDDGGALAPDVRGAEGHAGKTQLLADSAACRCRPTTPTANPTPKPVVCG